MAQLAGNAHWAKPSPLFAHRACPTPLKCKNEYLVLPLGEKTAVQAVVDSIVWAFRKLRKPRSREMSARGYALHSVQPQLSFFPFLMLPATAVNHKLTAFKVAATLSSRRSLEGVSTSLYIQCHLDLVIAQRSTRGLV